MIRIILYLALIGFSIAWAAFNIFDIDLGFDLDITRFLPGTVRPDAIPPMVSLIFVWTCLGLTALAYLVGLAIVYWNARSDAWRAILFTISIVIVGIGLVFFRLQIMGYIDRSSLYLIGVMILPFLPAIIYLPFAATYRDYLAPRS